MSNDDTELRLLMNRKLRELMMKAGKKPKDTEQAKKQNPRDVVLPHLVERGKEVLEAAEQQYPEQTRAVLQRIAELYLTNRLSGDISGGELLYLFRRLGIPVRIETSIKIEEHGKFVDLSEKLKLSSDSES